ncbi:MAG: hypothetical protein HPY71_08330 [Firmicutes bacterium]|nr:hypothetical protein [Bacillota bacterium]
MENHTLTIAAVIALLILAVAGTGGQPGVLTPSEPVLGEDPSQSAPPPTLPAPAPDTLQVSPEDRLLLASLIRAEAEGEPFEGQVAVGASVLNRVKNPRYPDSIPGVIYQIDSGYWQYQVVQDGSINLPPTPTSLAAADRALEGEDPSWGATGFYNPAKTSNPWVRSRPVTRVIGNHVFFR